MPHASVLSMDSERCGPSWIDLHFLVTFGCFRQSHHEYLAQLHGQQSSCEQLTELHSLCMIPIFCPQTSCTSASETLTAREAFCCTRHSSASGLSRTVPFAALRNHREFICFADMVRSIMRRRVTTGNCLCLALYAGSSTCAPYTLQRCMRNLSLQANL